MTMQDKDMVTIDHL